MDKIEELFPRLGVIAEHSQHGGGDSLAVNLLNSTHNHAHVSKKIITKIKILKCKLETKSDSQIVLPVLEYNVANEDVHLHLLQK